MNLAKPSCAMAAILLLVGQASAEELPPSIAVVRAVGPHGQGHQQAAEAWNRLAQAKAAELPRMLAAMDGANPLAANWLRAAVDTVAERAGRDGEAMPVAELERFVLQTEHAPRARRLAYELLLREDSQAEHRLLPTMLDDPSVELRRDAVARVVEEAESALKNNDRDQALAAFRRAMPAARDEDQIRLVAEQLRKLGEEVDLRRLMGFVVNWKLVGPFDNTDGAGFDAAFPPERGVDRGATYDGKHGRIGWMDYVAADEYGKVDLNAALVEEKGVVAYATTVFHSSEQRQVEFRVTSYNAVKLWVNGELVLDRKVYHSGSQLDQYVGKAMLREGGNEILVKVCQNEQTQDWARHWGFQLRVCDAVGSPVLSSDPQE